MENGKNILRINEREAFQCIDCGPRPKVLVIDGIAMGILKTELHKYKHEIVQELANKSKKEFEGSNFRDRMFIKQTKNRLLLRKAVKKTKIGQCTKTMRKIAIVIWRMIQERKEREISKTRGWKFSGSV